MKKVRTLHGHGCMTHYLGPTNHRCGRVVATNTNTGKKVTIDWDYALGCFENHCAAAEKLFGSLGVLPKKMTSCPWRQGGYIFVVH